MIAFEKTKNNIDQRFALSHAGVTLLVLLLAFFLVLHQGGLHRSYWDTLLFWKMGGKMPAIVLAGF